VDLKGKLSRLSGAGPGGGAAAVVAAPAPAPPEVLPGRMSAALERLGARVRALGPGGPALWAPGGQPPNLDRLVAPAPLPGECVQTPHGPVQLQTARFPPGARHGTVELRSALQALPAHLCALALDPSLAEADPRQMVLLDTETTGLAGGTGTLAFMVGLARFEGEALVAEQLLLRSPGEERAMLLFLAERLSDTRLLVTYNGKRFDWPLLRSRYVMNRLTPPTPPPHLDLLHCARRVFRHRLEGHRLIQVEEEILGHRREGDVDGSLVPEIYFRYLRSGDGGPVHKVLEHNLQDLLLLAALLGALVARFSGEHPALDPREQLGLASVAERAGYHQRALCFARGASGQGGGSIAVGALELEARLARKSGDPHGAAAALERALAVAQGVRAAELHLRLAKLYEHQLKDPARALAHALHCAAAEEPAANVRRLARLERRLPPPGLRLE
jgi:uncharacterized protein